jgi:hypothetical protein
MKKKHELGNIESTLNKAGDDEMLFILRAQDISSPLVILEWIKINFETAQEGKLQEAFNTALEIRRNTFRKQAD